MKLRASVLTLATILLSAAVLPSPASAGFGFGCGSWRLGCRIFARRCVPPPCCECEGSAAAEKSAAMQAPEEGYQKAGDCDGELCIVEIVAIIEDEEGQCIMATYYATICPDTMVYYDDSDCELYEGDCEDCEECLSGNWYYPVVRVKQTVQRAVEGKLARFGTRDYGGELKLKNGREVGKPKHAELTTPTGRKAIIRLHQIRAKGDRRIIGIGYEVKKAPRGEELVKIISKKPVDLRCYLIKVRIKNVIQRYVVFTTRKADAQ